MFPRVGDIVTNSVYGENDGVGDLGIVTSVEDREITVFWAGADDLPGFHDHNWPSNFVRVIRLPE